MAKFLLKLTKRYLRDLKLAAHIRQRHRHQDYLTLADRHSLRPVRQEEQTESKMSG